MNREDDLAVRGIELVDVTEEAVVVEEDFEEGAELTAIVAVQAENYVSGVERLELAARRFVEVAEVLPAALQEVDVGGHGVVSKKKPALGGLLRWRNLLLGGFPINYDSLYFRTSFPNDKGDLYSLS